MLSASFTVSRVCQEAKLEPRSIWSGGSIYLPYRLFVYVHSSFRNFRLEFWVGVANLQSWGRGGRRGSGLVPFERALASSYLPSILTFPLSLRILEILPLLFSSTPLFPYPTSSLPKISPCFHGNGWIRSTKSEVLG